MIGFLNNKDIPVSNDLLFGKNALTNNMGGIGTVNNVKIQNCKARHLFVTSDVTNNPTTTPPTDSTWATSYIMNDDLAHNIQAGNLSQVLTGLTSLLIKRKRMDDIENKWITIFNIPLPDDISGGFSFTVNDYLAKNNTEYAYALIPLVNVGNTIKEGETPTEDLKTVLSKFEDVFVCDRTDSYKLVGSLSYDNLTNIQLTGIHETLGSKYPIIVANSQVNYQTGGMTAALLNKEYLASMSNPSDTENHKLNRDKLRLIREKFEAFLTEKTPKIIKDMNGNLWLTMIVDNPDYTFYNNWGMGFGDVHFSWVQIGNAEEQDDLEAAGLIGGINTEG